MEMEGLLKTSPFSHFAAANSAPLSYSFIYWRRGISSLMGGKVCVGHLVAKKNLE